MYKDIIESNMTNEEKFYKIAELIHKKDDQALSEEEKLIIFVDIYLNEVNNGGFEQYFLNTEGEFADNTVKFLKKINGQNFSALLKGAIEIYTNEKDDDVRFDKLNELDNDFYELNAIDYDNLYKICVENLK
ncbi:MAG TPA: DUF4375 domain-containing protein [Bacillota bacterium]|nr:DUF4375 domain-containing protein [Bacillota bacterium]HOL10214.1 DUF4375 domain-containing protein [Bacillota bacterium]HPO97216.1 DUF4375 domain-containing protein [Bacillota bacterium]